MTKWWTVNLKHRSLFALKHPVYSVEAVVRDLLGVDERFLATVTGATSATIRRLMNEPFERPKFLTHLRNAEESLRSMKVIGADLFAKRILLQYAIVRAFKPDLILETGVANGISSTYILQALHQNNKGSLHSIEIGNSPYVSADRSVGWVVPEHLRSRWTLHLCDAQKCLPKLLEQLGEIDIFVHDSLHTYEHMKFEFEQAYPYIRNQGILISDDALWNNAFPDFADQMDVHKVRVIRGIGILQKPGT